MGLKARIANVLSFVRSTVNGERVTTVKADPGYGATVTAQHFASIGDDSHPLPGDLIALVPTEGAGAEVGAGYADPQSEGKAGPGGKRIYSRSGPGQASAEVWLKADGDILIKALAPGRTITIETSGPVVVNSPDVRLGPSPGRPVACIGDLVAGAISANSTAPGNAIVPRPPAVATPSGGVPFVGQIISGRATVKAG